MSFRHPSDAPPDQLLAEPSGYVDVLDTPGATKTAVRGSVVRTTGYVAAVFANALTLPFLFRYLGVVPAGQYVTVISLVTILTGIVENGLTGVSLRLYSVASPEARPTLMRELLSMRLAVLAIAGAVVGGFTVLAGYPAIILEGVALTSIGVVFENVGSTYNVWLAAHLRLGWIAFSTVIRQFIVAGLTLMLVIEHASLLAFFAAFIPASVAQFVVSALATKSESPLTPSADVRSWWALTRQVAPYVLAMALGFVYFRVPIVLMSMLLPGRDTGYFGAAFRIAETLTLLTTVLTAALPILTRAAHHDSHRHLYGLGRLVEVSLIFGAGLAVVTATGAAAAIRILAGPSFGESVGLLRALSVVVLLKFLTTAWGFALLSVGKYRPVLTANAFATASSIVVGLVAIPLVGVYGGVLSTCAAELGLMAAYGFFMRREMPTARFPARVAVVVIGGALAGAAVLFLPIPEVILPCLGITVYVVLLLLGSAIPPEALELLPRLKR